MRWHDRRREWTIAASLALVMVAAGCGSRGQTKRVPPPPAVVVVKAKAMDVPTVATSNATTRAINEVTVRARVKGFLNEVHFKEGSDVKKGQLLFVISEDSFQVQVAQAKAKLAEAQANLQRSEQSKAREVAAAKLALDQAALLLAKVEQQRTGLLFARNAIAKADVDTAEANFQKASAQVDSDKASLDQSNADFQTNILSGKANVELAKAQLRDAEINLGYCRMTAPIDGRIGEILVKVGNLVGSGQDTALATIEQLDPMGVDLQVSSRYLPRATELVSEGMTMSLTVGGTRVHKYPATSFFIDNKIDPTTSTFLVKATTPNPEKNLLPGEYARVEIVVGERNGAIVVPEKAVVQTQAGSTVYIVGSDTKVGVAPVVVVDTYRGMSVIESGLSTGQLVICEGLQLIRPGMPVKAEEAPFESQIRSTDPVAPPPSGAAKPETAPSKKAEAGAQS